MKLICNDKILDLSSPAVMGILNVTPDSFYDGGKYFSEEKILKRAEAIISEGAEIIDVGGYSTRPGAENVSEEEELRRIIPAIKLIRKNFARIIISVDTFRSSVANQSYEEGADIINDISGGMLDEQMFNTISKMKAAYILMHIQGTPQTMQKNPYYKNVVEEVKTFFSKKISALKELGKENIILDVGFGFGKTVEHNYELLEHLSEFKKFGFPILAGLSRKSMVNKILGIAPENALNGTTVVNTIALMNGADILRVHDVKEAKEAVKILNWLKSLKK